MTDEFSRFLSLIREDEKKGKIEFSKPITDFDLAVQFTLGKIGDVKGNPLTASNEEIGQAMIKYCGKDVFELEG